jgi:hypothetical protein
MFRINRHWSLSFITTFKKSATGPYASPPCLENPATGPYHYPFYIIPPLVPYFITHSEETATGPYPSLPCLEETATGPYISISPPRAPTSDYTFT